MTQPKLSLVFPCYHAAHHMQHVLEDLQAQTFKDFEAILVNDGDDSQVEAMEQIAAIDCRIRVVQQKQNQGVSAARNAGLDAVKAPWVIFADPDDHFGPNYLQSLFCAVDGTGADMACGGYTFFEVEKGEIRHYYIPSDNDCETTDLQTGLETLMAANGLYCCWSKIYNVKLIRENGVLFDESISLGEDVSFNLSYFGFVKKMCLVKDCDYVYYHYGRGSLTTQYTAEYTRQKLREEEAVKSNLFILGLTEQKVMEHYTLRILITVRETYANLFLRESNVGLSEAATRIQEDLFDNPECVNAILHGYLGNNRMLQLIRLLTRIGNARFAAVTFKTLAIGKNMFDSLYDRIKPFVRGESS